MALIDFILNLAGLLLLLRWRSMLLDPLTRNVPATLIGTLRPTERSRVRHWHLPLGVVAILVARAWLYWQLGPATEWTPRINAGIVALVFRSDVFVLALLYSFLSFARMLLIVYFWLTILLVINRRVLDADPIQRFIRTNLGPVGRWHWSMVIVLAPLAAAALYGAAHPALATTGVMSQAQSFAHLAGQSLVVGFALCFTLKYLFTAILATHLVLNYVYLGSSPLWDFISATARQLLAPLKWLPMRLGKLDLAPVIGAVGILLFLEALPNYIFARHPDFIRQVWPH